MSDAGFVLGDNRVLLLASGIKQRKDPIPFGPFLCIGAYIALLFSPYLIYFYLEFVLYEFMNL